jgi:hypothetical protein
MGAFAIVLSMALMCFSLTFNIVNASTTDDNSSAYISSLAEVFLIM